MKNVFNVVMRIFSSLIGVLMVLMGGVWTLQGLNLATGRMAQSFMENDRHWAVYGVILIALGVAQVYWSNTRQVKA